MDYFFFCILQNVSDFFFDVTQRKKGSCWDLFYVGVKPFHSVAAVKTTTVLQLCRDSTSARLTEIISLLIDVFLIQSEHLSSWQVLDSLPECNSRPPSELSLSRTNSHTPTYYYSKVYNKTLCVCLCVESFQVDGGWGWHWPERCLLGEFFKHSLPLLS